MTDNGYLLELTGKKVLMFIRRLVKEERGKNQLNELVDYVKHSKSNTDILINYVMNKQYNFCERMDPSQELLEELGIKIHESEARILYILEKYYDERDIDVKETP